MQPYKQYASGVNFAFHVDLRICNRKYIEDAILCKYDGSFVKELLVQISLQWWFMNNLYNFVSKIGLSWLIITKLISKEREISLMSFNKETHISCICVFQSLIFLGCVAAAGLGVNLLCLAIYLSCLCCCRKDEEEEESKKSNSCCVTWAAVAAGLICWYVSHRSHTERINPLKMQAA